jgi:SpoVK/Ycf46/Vps4 family AAA+-type ATPase
MRLDSDIDLDVYASLSEGFSGADLQAFIYSAQLEAVHEQINSLEHSYEHRVPTQEDNMDFSYISSAKNLDAEENVLWKMRVNQSFLSSFANSFFS